MTQHKARMLISRRHDDGESTMHIEFRGDEFPAKVFSVECSVAALMNALTGLADQECLVEYYPHNLQKLGKSRETKEVLIRDKGAHKEEPTLSKQLQGDGWVYVSGYGSYKRLVQKEGVDYYNCRLERFVDFD